MRHLIRINLEANDMRVCDVANLGQCLGLMQEQSCALLLLSMEPDEPATQDVVLTIRKHVKDRVPVLFVTNTQPSNTLLAQLSPAAYVRKPFDVAHLVRCVETLLTGKTSC